MSDNRDGGQRAVLALMVPGTKKKDGEDRNR